MAYPHHETKRSRRPVLHRATRRHAPYGASRAVAFALAAFGLAVAVGCSRLFSLSARVADPIAPLAVECVVGVLDAVCTGSALGRCETRQFTVSKPDEGPLLCVGVLLADNAEVYTCSPAIPFGNGCITTVTLRGPDSGPTASQWPESRRSAVLAEMADTISTECTAPDDGAVRVRCQ